MKDLGVLPVGRIDISIFAGNHISGGLQSKGARRRWYFVGVKAAGVDVWCLQLTAGESVHEFAQLLSPAERERAACFRAEMHRRKFELARGVLRWLLGRYLDREPRDLEFEYGTHGKPFVNTTRNSAQGLRFNVAHSGDMALYAMSPLEVGIDIEQTRPLPDLMSIARRFLSAAEATELARLTGDAKSRGFHHCWARKEAYIKALGVGLSLPLESFCVSLLPGEPARVKEIRGKPGLEAEWRLEELAVAEKYACRVSGQGAGNQPVDQPRLARGGTERSARHS